MPRLFARSWSSVRFIAIFARCCLSARDRARARAELRTDIDVFRPDLRAVDFLPERREPVGRRCGARRDPPVRRRRRAGLLLRRVVII